MTDRSNCRIHWLPDEHRLGEPVQIGMILFPSQWILTPFGILMHNLNPHCKIIKMLHNLHQIFTLIASEAQRHGVVTIPFLWVTWKDVTKCDPGVSRSVTNCPRVIGPRSVHRASINQTCSETRTCTLDSHFPKRLLSKNNHQCPSSVAVGPHQMRVCHRSLRFLTWKRFGPFFCCS